MSTGKLNAVMAVIRAARPSFRNEHDKVAFAVHASYLASGYFLTATGPSAYADDALSSSAEEVGIEQWNELEDEYAFVYVKPEGDAKKILVKCLAMNDKLVVDAVKDGGREPVHTEINVGEFVGEAHSSNYSAQYKNLENLVKTLDEEILSKLDSPSTKPTPTPTPTSTSSESSRGSSVREPWNPLMHHPRVVNPPVFPYGSSDLFPTPPAGAYPSRSGFIGDGGMLIGPNDPRWFGGRGIHPGVPGAPPGVPPGARFDPYGPPDVPGFEPERFVRNPRRPGNGTHPDLEHFRDGSDFI